MCVHVGYRASRQRARCTVFLCGEERFASTCSFLIFNSSVCFYVIFSTRVMYLFITYSLLYVTILYHQLLVKDWLVNVHLLININIYWTVSLYLGHPGSLDFFSGWNGLKSIPILVQYILPNMRVNNRFVW